MKKKYFWFLVLVPIILKSQTFNLKWGDEFSGYPMDSHMGVFKKNSDDYCFIRSVININKKLIFIHNVGKNLNSNIKNELKLPFENGYSGPFFELKGNIYWITLKKNKKERKLERFIISINEKLEIDKIVHIDDLKYNDYDDFPNIKICFSPDSSKLLIYNIFDSDEKKIENVLNFTCLNNNFEVIFQNNYNFKVSQNLVDVQNVIISNDANVYLLSKTYKSSNKKEWNSKLQIPNYSRAITVVYPDGKANTKNLDVKKLTALGSIGFSALNDIFVVLPYANEKSIKPEGLNIYKFDKNNFDIMSNIRRDFTSEELKKFGTWSKKDYEEFWFYINQQNWIVEPDGFNCYLEKTFFRTEKYGRSIDTYRYSKDCMNFKIDNSGILKNINFVPKNFVEKSIGDFGQSFMFQSNNINYFLYNDRKKNLECNTSNYEDFSSKGNGAITTVLAFENKNGDLVRKELIDEKDYVVIPFLTQKITENKYLICLVHIKFLSLKYKFGELIINP